MKEQRYASSGARLEEHIEALAEYNATPGRGVTRFSYTEPYRQARDYLLSRFRELGLDVSVDPLGNIRAGLEGAHPNAPPVWTGSHIDTVLHGGGFDGVVGVVCALEALTVFRERGFRPERPIELIVFVEEEGASFGAPLAGSKAMVGTYSPQMLKALKNDRGVSMHEAAKRFGLDPDAIEGRRIEPGQVHAMVEVHIEQSLVLDTEKIPVGIVTGIAGMRWLEVEIAGQPDHAGATPMRYRRDPMAGAAEVISLVERTAKTRALEGTVGTVGKIVCTPNVPNVIPERVRLVVDTRDVETEGMSRVRSALEAKLEELASGRRLRYSLKSLGEIEPTRCSKRIAAALQSSADALGIGSRRMVSGALHDTAVLAGVTDIGMLFVPSKDGRSHVPEELTDLDDITKGCDVLIGALVRLAEI